MASTLISNPVSTTDRSRDSSKRRKKKKAQALTAPENHQNPNQWKSEAQQEVYKSKFLTALRQVRVSSPPSSSSSSAPRTARCRAVREAADRVLAITAKGRTRWSRAILTNRLKVKFLKSKRQRVRVTGNSRFVSSKKPRVSVLRLKGKNLPAVQRKVKVLGRLVPGCRKEALPVILEEATDYIAALEMQVRALSALTELLSGGGSSAGSSSNSIQQR